MLSAKIPNSIRKQVYARDGYRCALCDSTQGIQIHHVIPRGCGGNSTPYNLITLCSYCHSHAHGRPLYETDVTAADIAQYCLEYVSDYYAEDPDFFPLKSLK